jgi:hypothetical protein
VQTVERSAQRIEEISSSIGASLFSLTSNEEAFSSVGSTFVTPDPETWETDSSFFQPSDSATHISFMSRQVQFNNRLRIKKVYSLSVSSQLLLQVLVDALLR